MDSKETKESKDLKEVRESKEIKELETGNENRRGLSYVVIILIIVGLILISVLVFKQAQITKLSGQVVKLTEENKNLNSQVNESFSTADSLKNFYGNIKSGNVPFWGENNKGAVTAIIPLNFYTARKLSEKIILGLNDNAENLVFKDISRNQTIWTAVFSCKDDLNNSECGKQVIIDDGKKTYIISPAA